MLNPITFIVEAESGPLTVTASGLDYAAYEDKFDKAAIAGIAGSRYVTWVYLVWNSMQRQEMTALTFEEFLATTPQFTSMKDEGVPPLESKAPTGK